MPHSYTFRTDEVRMLALVAPGGIEQLLRDPRFAEEAEAPTLPLEPPGSPEMAVLEEMTKDLVGYGTEVVGPPDPPQEG